jgi:hypothetical protein
MKRWTTAAFLITFFLVCTLPVSAATATYLFGDSTTAPGATLTINGTPFAATGQGWWSVTLANGSGNVDYLAGDPVGDGTSLNDFFTFDLSSFTGPALSAVLSIVTLGTVPANLPITYTLYDVSTPAATLDVVGGTNAAIWADLGSGNSYGQVLVTTYPPVALSIDLDGQALSDINAAAGGLFSIGGTTNTPLSATPEPGTVWLLAGGLLAAACIKRRARA